MWQMSLYYPNFIAISCFLFSIQRNVYSLALDIIHHHIRRTLELYFGMV